MAYTVLIVEDDPNINEVITEYMKEAGYIVISAVDGKLAETIINTRANIDLFILDIMLPGVSGLELLRIIRKSSIHNLKPVVVLTAIDDETTQILSFDEMADDYMTKPFSPRILVKRAEALMRRTGVEKAFLEKGSLIIDFERYEVFENGEKLMLTLREFELFGVLMNNAGKVLSRQQLLNHAWGYDYFGDERIVDVHIKNLRKKLASNPIITVKGVGYKLEVE